MKTRTPEQELEDCMKDMRRLSGWLETIHLHDSLNKSSTFTQTRFVEQLTSLHAMMYSFAKTRTQLTVERLGQVKR